MSNITSSDSNGTKNYFVNYNQDSTSLVLGSKSGYRLYSLNNVDDLELIYSNDVEETYMVERLFSSSLVATVALSSPRKLKVCHFKKGTEICNYSYSNTILAVRMNRSRLVVCLEESLYIHNIRDMKVLHTIRDTPPNPQGLCALSINHDNCLLAYPGSATIGEVQIFDADHLHAKTMIPAHDSPLAALAFSPNGTRIATASEKGTVIRVFSSADGQKLYEFRRGVKRCVDISSLAFSTCSQFLCCSSNTETVHVFKFEEPKESPKRNVEESSWMGYLSSYLPTQVTDVFTQGRAFAAAHLPTQGLRNVISIMTAQNQLRLLVATEEAKLYVYNLDPNEGGDLTLYKQHRLDDSRDTRDSSKGTAMSEPQSIDGGSAILASYAGIVKGNPVGQMSESEKLREMAAATESPPKGPFHFNDDQEYPPLTQNSD
ncbi:WD repeat domain phosphoinositide-interacting protein 2 isoform X2 [Tribolium castaneum]|uniref:WD repeat domain phosphoinositide-interacting protein 2 isoform X2 n=1 Tax=Tribolium castaneum TaxID=7070 RepID=UPI00046C15A9|nr:PREDICTED: WD repeat domain phosphoinositide-interacting protein 2 isoform X2 [Tribolium castaneum]|eukprot:XP_008196483.1 PREDICTED: WD repeat domain phosphoinositide-interacting protein 2 isoform X2 [Tribolium castaneum]